MSRSASAATRCIAFFLASAALAGACLAADLSREQALAALERPEAATRLAGIERLAEIGAMADVDSLLGRLGDGDARVRAATSGAIWQIWGRSGDAAARCKPTGCDRECSRAARCLQQSGASGDPRHSRRDKARVRGVAQREIMF